MDTIVGFFKFLFWVCVTLCIIGIITTISCIKKVQHSYNEHDVYVPDIPSINIPDTKSTSDTTKTSTYSSINWTPIESLKSSEKKCVMLYFSTTGCCSEFEQQVLDHPVIIQNINEKFVSSRVPDRAGLHERFNIYTFPTIMFLPQKGKGVKINGNVTGSKILSIINGSQFSDC